MPRPQALSVAGALLVLGVLAAAQSEPPSPLVLLSREGRRPLPTSISGAQELIALDDVASLFQVSVKEDALAGGFTVTYKGRNLALSRDQAMASVSGRLISLPAPPRRQGRRWLVPVEFLSRALSQIYDARIDLRKASRLVLLGDISVPHVTVRSDASSSSTRLLVSIAPAASVSIVPEPGANRLTIRVLADALDVDLSGAAGGLVDRVTTGDAPMSLVAVLRPGTGQPRTASSTSDGTTLLTIDIPAAPSLAPPTAATPPSGTSAQAGADPVPERPTALTMQALVLDPGHGGDDVGVRLGDLTEKQLTLDVARRVKALVEARLGIRVVLTRDSDQALSPDERAALANYSRADAFISLHLNASHMPQRAGAEIFQLRPPVDAYAFGGSEEGVALPSQGGGLRNLELVPWDSAQLRHLEASTALATALVASFDGRVPMSERPQRTAPLRVLASVNMPGVLVEMAYLTNPEQGAQLGRTTLPNALADAITDGITRFRDQVDRR